MSSKVTINPVLDITEFWIPLELKEVFNNNRELALEIGFGDGDFLIQLAQERQHMNYVGIEVKYGRFRKAVNGLLKQGVSNVKLLHMDATIALDEVFKPDTFSDVYINFPDPWPKDRHKKHRLINKLFLDKLSEIMKPGASLAIASDHMDYIEHILTVFKESNSFKNSSESPGYTEILTNRPLTKYEIEYRMEGRKIFYLSFVNHDNS